MPIVPVTPFLPALLLVLAGVGGTAQAQAAPPPASQAPRPLHVIPFELYDNRIYVQVHGPGFGPSWFIVDTGAQATHFTMELVRRAGLPAAGGVGISGTGSGRIRGVYVRPVTLTIGSLSLRVGRGVAAPAEETFGAVYQGSGRRFEGVIGYDLFAAYIVEIDYTARELRLYPSGSPAAAGATPIRLIDRKPYLEAVLEVGGGPLPAMLHLDTGYGGAVSLNGRFVARQRLIDRAGPSLRAWSRGVGGIGEARTARFDSVRVGSFTLVRPIVSLALEQGAGVRADSAGRIGGDLLRRFTVRLDYTARTLVLTPGPARDEPFEIDMSGLSLIQEGAAILVWRVGPGTPAAEAGVREGDQLLALDGMPVAGLSLEAVRARLRGEGERRRLGLDRAGAGLETELVLRRRL